MIAPTFRARRSEALSASGHRQ